MVELLPLWTKTPLIYSEPLSHRLNCDVYLKLENLQPSQSFKFRGLSLFAQEAFAKHGPGVHLVIASGGNAGIALAHAAKKLQVRCTVFLPEGARSLVPSLESIGASVDVGGINYLAAWRKAQKTVEEDPHAVMAHAYDDPVLFRGHSSMIEEIHEQLPKSIKPSAILCSVGGGGLIGGVFTGCKAVGWDDVPVIALETQGSNCFYQSVLANSCERDGREDALTCQNSEGTILTPDVEHGVIVAHIPAINSRATSLGASSPSAPVVKMALDREGSVRCVCIPDEMGMKAALDFAEDHKMVVELACSTTLTPAYYPKLLDELLVVPSGRELRRHTLVFIVCGGVKISSKELAEFEGLIQSSVSDEVWIDGRTLSM